MKKLSCICSILVFGVAAHANLMSPKPQKESVTLKTNIEASRQRYEKQGHLEDSIASIPEQAQGQEVISLPKATSEMEKTAPIAKPKRHSRMNF